jgi:adenosylcobinamide-GDP ribazoletransferase
MRERLLHELRLALLALQLFTRVPVTGRLAAWVGWQPAWLSASARHFPLIGLLVGGAGALVLLAAGLWWPTAVAVLLSMVATVVMTGAFHEDGFADTCDALGGAVTRERALEIMKDSRVGSYAVVGLLLLLGLKASALAAMPPAWAAAALLGAHAASRTVAVALIAALPYAGDVAHAKAKPLAQQIAPSGLFVACGWAAAGPMLIAGLAPADVPGLAAWSAAWLAAAVTGVLCARWFRRRLGGFTGDTLGAAQQLSEVACYLALLAVFAA